MSRTDKTTPYWVRAAWWEPHHWRCQHSRFSRGRPCDLPSEPVVDKTYNTRRRISDGCAWHPSYDGAYNDWHGSRAAPGWYCREFFTAPQRRRVRDQLVRARQEHRAGGEVEVIVETDQHRHRGRWAWS